MTTDAIAGKFFSYEPFRTKGSGVPDSREPVEVLGRFRFFDHEGYVSDGGQWVLTVYGHEMRTTPKATHDALTRMLVSYQDVSKLSLIKGLEVDELGAVCLCLSGIIEPKSLLKATEDNGGEMITIYQTVVKPRRKKLKIIIRKSPVKGVAFNLLDSMDQRLPERPRTND